MRNFFEAVNRFDSLVEKSKGHSLARERRRVGGGPGAAKGEKRRVRKKRRALEKSLKSYHGKRSSDDPMPHQQIPRVRLDPRNVS